MADISVAAKVELEIAPEDAEEFEKTLKANGWTVEGIKKALTAVSPSTENLPLTSNKNESMASWLRTTTKLSSGF